jgi:putative ABC transport system substrate-binding protein
LTNLGVELNTKRLELLKFAIPSLTRVAAFWDSAASSPLTAKKTLDEVTSTARTLRMQVRFLRVDGPDQIARTFSPIPNETPEALLIFHSSMFFTERRRIVELVAKHQLPSMFPARDYVELGGLLAYGVKVADLFRRSASYVHKILQGAKPADLPIEQATNFELVINAMTAKTLGIPIGESLLSRADEVIE